MAWRIRIRSLQHSATVAVNDDRGGRRRIVFGVAQIAGACKSRCNGRQAKQTVTKPSAGSSPCHRAPRPSRRPPSHLDYLEWSSPEGYSSRLKWLFSRHHTALRSALLPSLAAKEIPLLSNIT